VAAADIVQEAVTWGIRRQTATAVVSDTIDQVIDTTQTLEGDPRVLATIRQRAERMAASERTGADRGGPAQIALVSNQLTKRILLRTRARKSGSVNWSTWYGPNTWLPLSDRRCSEPGSRWPWTTHARNAPVGWQRPSPRQPVAGGRIG
jgi:hypothetical protein